MKAKILLVDDSKTLQTLFKRLIEKAGYEVVGCASDGVQGLAAYQEKKPDLTFMDVTMPNMSGKECLEAILKVNPKAIVVMISALDDPQVKSDCIKSGAKAFVLKSEVNDMVALEQKLVFQIRHQLGEVA